jgi:hypothetical protein
VLGCGAIWQGVLQRELCKILSSDVSVETSLDKILQRVEEDCNVWDSIIDVCVCDYVYVVREFVVATGGLLVWFGGC